MAVQFRRQIHQSGVTMFGKCGTQFEYVYIRHMRRPPASFLICGKATDQAVNHDLDTKILKGELAPKDEVIDVALESIEKNPESKEVVATDEEIGKTNAQIIDMVKDKARRLVTAHHALVAPESGHSVPTGDSPSTSISFCASARKRSTKIQSMQKPHGRNVFFGGKAKRSMPQLDRATTSLERKTLSKEVQSTRTS